MTFAAGFPSDVEVTEAITRFYFEERWKVFLSDDPDTIVDTYETSGAIILPDIVPDFLLPIVHLSDSIELTYVGSEATLPDKYGLRSGTEGKERVVFEEWEYYSTNWGETSIHGFESYYFEVDALFWFEFEKIGLSFCGPGCCGAEWMTGINLFFAEYRKFDDYTTTGWIDDKATGGRKAIVEVAYEPFNPTLFGLNRFAFDASVPVMENFMLAIDFAYNLYTKDTQLGLGWTFVF